MYYDSIFYRAIFGLNSWRSIYMPFCTVHDSSELLSSKYWRLITSMITSFQFNQQRSNDTVQINADSQFDFFFTERFLFLVFSIHVLKCLFPIDFVSLKIILYTYTMPNLHLHSVSFSWYIFKRIKGDTRIMWCLWFLWLPFHRPYTFFYSIFSISVSFFGTFFQGIIWNNNFAHKLYEKLCIIFSIAITKHPKSVKSCESDYFFSSECGIPS